MGAPLDNAYAGTAYVFSVGPGDAAWRLEAALTADDAVTNDEFGYSVAIDGDTVVVGAPFHSVDFFGGAAYVFVRDAASGTWSKQGETLARGETDFGNAVAISGDEIAVGEPDRGSVYTYSRSSSAWSFDTQIAPTDVSFLGGFGSSLSMDATGRLLVGAPYDSAVALNQGSAHMFALSRSGWDRQAVLRPSGKATFQLYGASVALSDQAAIVGAPWENGTAGAMHLLTYDDLSATWSEQGVFQSPTPAAGALFGNSVAVAGQMAVIGEPGRDQTYVFTGLLSTSLSETTMTGDSRTLFGASVATDGTRVVVTAPIAPGSSDGAAYIFLNDRIFADGFD